MGLGTFTGSRWPGTDDGNRGARRVGETRHIQEWPGLGGGGGPGWAGTVVRGNPKPEGTTHKIGILGRPPWAQDCAARVGVQALGEPPCASAFP